MNFRLKKKSFDTRNPSQIASEEELRAACKGRRRARKALMDRYDPVIIQIAQSFNGDKVHQFTLVEAGRNGMQQALNLFNVDRDPTEFPSFAKKIIERSMLLEWKHS